MVSVTILHSTIVAQWQSLGMEWQPTPVFLTGESHGQRSLVGCSPWSHTVGHD